jgi:hypothetical protein
MHLKLQTVFIRVDILSQEIDWFSSAIVYTYLRPHSCLLNVELGNNGICSDLFQIKL